MSQRLFRTVFLPTLCASCVAPVSSRLRPVDDVPSALRVARFAQEEPSPPVVDLDPPAASERAPERAPLAAPEKPPWSRFGLGVGGIITAVDSGVRLGFEGVGIELDLEEIFDLDTSATRLYSEAFWRFTENRRHRWDITVLDLRRNATLVLDREIDLGNGQVIPIGARADTKLDLTVFKTQYGYSFFQDDRFDLALTGGFYVLPVDFQLDASGDLSLSESFGVTAPLPVLGFRFDFAVTPAWFLRSDVDLFYLEFGDFRGAIASWNAGVEYQPWEHLAFGAGFDSFRLGVERNGSTSLPGVDEAGSVDFGYLGFGLFIKTVW